MKPGNIRTMAIAFVAVLLVLLVSWQMYGQDDEEESMLGTWIVASSDGMPAAPEEPLIPVGAEVSITEEKGCLRLISGTVKEWLFPLSCCEAMTLNKGTFRQLYLCDDSLHFFDLTGKSVSEVVMTRDGGAASCDVPAIAGPLMDLTASSFKVMDGKLEDLEVSVDASEQKNRLVTVKSGSLEGAGFIKGDGDRIVIQCAFEDQSSICIVKEGDYSGVSGNTISSDGSVMFIGDSDGRISEDAVGVSGVRELSYPLRDDIKNMMTATYKDGILYGGKDPMPSMVYTWTADGTGYFSSYSRLCMVLYGDDLYLVGVSPLE